MPVVAVNVWYHVGSGQRAAGPHRLRAPVRAPDVRGVAGTCPREQFDTLLEGAGGSNNGSTNTDRTNYFIDVPSNALELALYLESDRMGYLLDAMSPARVDGQRDVVKNERRQSYENRPYGMASIVLDELLFPDDHPYHWPTIGYTDDLSAASYEDVVEFFRRYYAPNNASLVVAGDIDLAATRAAGREVVRRGAARRTDRAAGAARRRAHRRHAADADRPRAASAPVPRVAHPAALRAGRRRARRGGGRAGGGKNSRLYKRLVYDLQMAQDVSARQQSGRLASAFVIDATPRPGHTVAEMQRSIDEEIETLKREPPDRARGGPRPQPDRGLVLQPHGARRAASAARPTS